MDEDLLRQYCKLGWKLIPIKNGSKRPAIDHWPTAATSDVDKVLGWANSYKRWGVVCGSASGILAVDADRRDGHDGIQSFERLQSTYDPQEEKTLTYSTPNGKRYIYRLPEGLKLRSSKDKLAPGVEIFADAANSHPGKQVLIPPSEGYEWDHEFDPSMIIVVPDWLVQTIQANESTIPHKVPTDTRTLSNSLSDELEAKAFRALKQLADWRREDYDAWIKVGMSLKELGPTGLTLWDNWSQKSEKYHRGECARKWESFSQVEGITLRSLFHWAKKDNPESLLPLPRAPSSPKPSDYKRAIEISDWEFRLNEANYDLEINGVVMSRPIRAVISNHLREYGYKDMEIAQDCFFELGLLDHYHPVKDYLESLVWDGNDHIGKLATYFKDKHNVFETWIKRWLIGAIARVYLDGAQNRMLVLDGKQNLGKSYFVRWLGSGLPSMRLESPIRPDNKDFDTRLMGTWIWEVAELGSTIRRADREALKFFISKEWVTVRKPWDKDDTKRPALASFIGTVNNEAGFLSDPTGSRRFMCCTLTTIDWSYANDVDVNQLWAQAYHLYKSGTSWILTHKENELAAKINSEYEIEDPMESYILNYYEIDPSRSDWFTPTITILDTLKQNGKADRNDRITIQQIGSVLNKFGCEQDRRRQNRTRCRGWIGVRIRSA